MMFLADENIPRLAIESLRQIGVDITAVGELSPGIEDREVLALSAREGRVLITFDKDFAEIVFRGSFSQLTGIILIRFTPASPQQVAETLRSLLQSEHTWEGHFTVVTDTRIRMVPLPRS